MARPNNDTVDSFLEKYPHLKKQWDYEKNKERINEDKLIYVTNKYWWKCAKDHSWEATITSRKCGLNCPICSGHKILKGYNDLASQRPDLLEEWDFEKNTRIFPDNVTEYSNKKVWWICKKHHSWQAVIGYRALGFGCPVCASRKLLPGYNDLATKRPDLAEAWDYEKNDGLTPQMIMPASNRKVWWRCKKGHSYQSTPSNRLHCIESCYYCNGKRVLAGFNDIATTHPEILKLWDYDKNTDISPEKLSAGRAKKVWWKCEEGHSWQAPVGRICKKDGGCPYCAGRRIIKGKNDLLSVNPALAAQWDEEKNGISADQVFGKSAKKYWWKCEVGHSWAATINSRVRNIVACPICNGRKLQSGDNDIVTTHPEALKLWDYEKNTGVDPTSLSAKSLLKVWWKCENGHSWMGMIRSNAKGECPYCAGRYKGKTRFIT